MGSRAEIGGVKLKSGTVLAANASHVTAPELQMDMIKLVGESGFWSAGSDN